MTNQQFELDEDDVRRWVDGRSFSRGQNYFSRGAIMNPRLLGDTLRASCRGSMPEPYHLWLKLSESGIVGGDCSCPVGSGGHCKHAAALLLTWVHTPDEVIQTASLDETLARRSKDELVQIIRRMIARYPDLETLAAGPAIAGKTDAVSPEDIRRQVDEAISHGGYDYGAAAQIRREIESIAKQGDRLLAEAAWAEAAVVYMAIIDEVLEQYD